MDSGPGGRNKTRFRVYRNARETPAERAKMKNQGLSRRDMLKAAAGVLAGGGALVGTTFQPRDGRCTAAGTGDAGFDRGGEKEGQVIHYTSTDLPVAEKLARAFEAKYSGISVRVERTGAERVFQRIGQEYSSHIHAVDVVNSSDASHFIVWKRDGILAPYVPEDVAKFYPPEHRDVDGQFASWRVWLSIIAYNTSLVKAEDAPKSFADLLDARWKGKIVKGHPGYSGTIMTATYQMQRDLGWSWFEQLAKQNVMQVQSSADPPKKLELGERAIMADGNEYNILQMKETGTPGRAGLCQRRIAADYRSQRHLQGLAEPERGQAVPVVLFQPGGPAAHHRYRRPALGASADPGKAGRMPFKDIKTMKDDAAAVEKQGDSIKSRYTRIFRV